jgi:transcriptional regulator with XRE-family HTH domain
MPIKAALSEQLRPLIEDSGMSRYRICKEIGLAESTMSRFMAGRRGLSMEVLDQLFPLLGLRVVKRDRPPPGKRPKER